MPSKEGKIICKAMPAKIIISKSLLYDSLAAGDLKQSGLIDGNPEPAIKIPPVASSI
jgi:hypothetical protein